MTPAEVQDFIWNAMVEIIEGKKYIHTGNNSLGEGVCVSFITCYFTHVSSSTGPISTMLRTSQPYSITGLATKALHVASLTNFGCNFPPLP